MYLRPNLVTTVNLSPRSTKKGPYLFMNSDKNNFFNPKNIKTSTLEQGLSTGALMEKESASWVQEKIRSEELF